ncbi:MAG TPA: hypothetical protein EYN67_14750 [Flavobacteriales bacterium]|nr:hypothetical protein [Flavobacteriales bacterium]
MKVTKANLKRIIKEEIKKTFEDLKRARNTTLLDLYEFSNLVQSGEREARVTGMDMSSGTKAPITMTLSLVDEEPATTLSGGTKVAVPDDLLGQPFNVAQFSKYTFVLKH